MGAPCWSQRGLASVSERHSCPRDDVLWMDWFGLAWVGLEGMIDEKHDNWMFKLDLIAGEGESTS